MNIKINFTRVFLIVSIICGILTMSINEMSDIFDIVLTVFIISLMCCVGFFVNLSQEDIHKVLIIDFFKKIGIDVDND